MILATMGSNKSVTTMNAIMTEVFTGLKPEKIRIYREDSNLLGESKKTLEKALSILGIQAEVEEKVVGEDLRTWKEVLSMDQVDVFDVTPGRKYMAIAATYSHGNSVRYVYIKEEVEGYRIFGYIPFSRVKVLDVRSGEKVELDRLSTLDADPYSRLERDSLTALYNILAIHGTVEVDEGASKDDREDYVELCKMRAGGIRFREEEEIRKFRGSLFIADTNTYINIGPRLRDLVNSRKINLLASKAVFDELMGKVVSGSKDPKLWRFSLGVESYRDIHKIPFTKGGQSYGDRSLIEEIRNIKYNVQDQVILLTRDRELSAKASTLGIKTIFLSQITKGHMDYGEYIYCLSRSGRGLRNPTITVDGKDVVEIRENPGTELGITQVVTKDRRYNFAKVLELLQEIMRRDQGTSS